MSLAYLVKITRVKDLSPLSFVVSSYDMHVSCKLGMPPLLGCSANRWFSSSSTCTVTTSDNTARDRICKFAELFVISDRHGRVVFSFFAADGVPF